MWLLLYDSDNRIKRFPQLAQFIEDDSQGPDIRPLGGLLAVVQLGTHVQTCALHSREGSCLRHVSLLGDAKVPKFEKTSVVQVQKYIFQLYVPVDHPVLVQILYCSQKLVEHFEDCPF